MSIVAVATNPFERYQGIGKPDEKKTLKTDDRLSKKLEEVLASFERLQRIQLVTDPDELKRELLKIEHTLTPEEINIFAQVLVRFEEPKYAGAMITRLIQRSYNAGHNDFQIDVRAFTEDLGDLCSDLRGTKRKPVIVTVNGNLYIQVGDSANHISLTINGNVGDLLGVGAKHSIFTLNGSAKDVLGEYSINCTYTVQGKTGDAAGKSAHNSTFHFHGPVGKYLGYEGEGLTFHLHDRWGEGIAQQDPDEIATLHTARFCKFIVYNKKQFGKLKRELPDLEGNKVILMGKNGRVLKEVER